MHSDPRKRKRASETTDATKGQPSQRQKIRNVQDYIDATLTTAEREAMFNGILIRKSATDETKPHLLGLPKELRLQIWEFALIEDTPIFIAADGLEQPALLRVCQQIRGEGLPPYYKYNQFVWVLKDFNMTPLLPAVAIRTKYIKTSAKGNGGNSTGGHPLKARRPVRTMIEFTGVPNWQNLVEWLRLHYSNEGVPGFGDQDKDPTFVMITALFDAALHLVCRKVSWAVFSTTLDAWRQIFILNDPAWAK
ncbi:hypothetical protein LTR17_000025 [Elasticomyces elasticus]|nr:hypothetical protein LTR17_000025 [Elasticomyces elasticus]